MKTNDISSCVCGGKTHDFQDNAYGKGMRVFNRLKSKDGNKSSEGRCTVCGVTKKLD